MRYRRLGRRRAPDPEAERLRAAFAVVAERIHAAQRAVLAAIPTPRDPGTPLGAALEAFDREAAAAARLMAAWREVRTEAWWSECAVALGLAREEARRLATEPGPLGFETLNARAGDVLHPLERFVDAERAVRRL